MLRWGMKVGDLPEAAQWAGCLRIGLFLAAAVGLDRCAAVMLTEDE